MVKECFDLVSGDGAASWKVMMSDRRTELRRLMNGTCRKKSDQKSESAECLSDLSRSMMKINRLHAPGTTLVCFVENPLNAVISLLYVWNLRLSNR